MGLHERPLYRYTVTESRKRGLGVQAGGGWQHQSPPPCLQQLLSCPGAVSFAASLVAAPASAELVSEMSAHAALTSKRETCAMQLQILRDRLRALARLESNENKLANNYNATCRSSF